MYDEKKEVMRNKKILANWLMKYRAEQKINKWVNKMQ